MNQPQTQKKTVSPWVWLGAIAIIGAALWAGCSTLIGSNDTRPAAAPTTKFTTDNGLQVEYVNPLSEMERKQLANKACRAGLQLPTGAQFMDQGQVALAMTDGSNKVIVAGKILLASGDRRSWRCEATVLDDKTVTVLEVALR